MPARADIGRKRQDAILEIIGAQRVARQTQLVELLHARGIEATQSSVSRDLKSLGVTKLADVYVAPSESPGANGGNSEQPAGESAGANDRELTLLGEFIRRIDTAGGNLTVVKTAVGAAQRVAVYLDRTGWPEIVGTLSGDDSIFVATRNAAEQRQLIAKLRAQLEG